MGSDRTSTLFTIGTDLIMGIDLIMGADLIIMGSLIILTGSLMIEPETKIYFSEQYLVYSFIYNFSINFNLLSHTWLSRQRELQETQESGVKARGIVVRVAC